MVEWIDIRDESPRGCIVLLKTRQWFHIHCMADFKTGEVRAWDQQDERWTGGEFDYEDVTHWALLRE